MFGVAIVGLAPTKKCEEIMIAGDWRAVSGEAGLFESRLTADDNPRHQLGSRSVISAGHGFVHLFSSCQTDSIFRPSRMVDVQLSDRVVSLRMATPVRMTYAEAIAFDRNLRPIVRMLHPTKVGCIELVRCYGAPGYAFQARALSWFRRAGRE